MRLARSPAQRRSHGASRHLAFGLTLLAAGLWSPAASAHSPIDIGAFYAGAAELVLHWQHALYLLAGGLWCSQQSEPYSLWLGTTLTGGLIGGALFVWAGLTAPNPDLWAGLGYGLTGLATAGNLQAIKLWPLGPALAAGMASGIGLGTTALPGLEQPLLFLSGAAVGASLLMFYAAAAAMRLPAGWPQVGVRIAGSWIAAIGLMVCAFSLQSAS